MLYKCFEFTGYLPSESAVECLSRLAWIQPQTTVLQWPVPPLFLASHPDVHWCYVWPASPAEVTPSTGSHEAPSNIQA